MKNGGHGAWTPLRIALVYGLFGVLWILFSDAALLYFASDPWLYSSLQTCKGWFFILVTALLLFWLMFRMMERQEAFVLESRKTAQALWLSEEKFAKAFRNSPTAIALTSISDGKLAEVNESFLVLSGYGAEEVQGRSTLDLNLWVDVEARQRYFDTLRATGKATGLEAEFRKKNGEVAQGLVSGEIIEIQGQAYVLTVILDISARKQAEFELARHREHLEELVRDRTLALEESQTALLNIVDDLNHKTMELEEANTKLRELDRLKSMFIASMSHELRTPLNSIIGFSGILLQGLSGDINEEQRDHLGRVFRSGKHLLSLITDVIDIAKIESGKISPFPEQVDLPLLVEEALEQISQQAAEKGLAVKRELPVGDLPLRTDRRRLLQCLLNYLSNAVKFTENGSITIAARYPREFPGEIEISVRDTGVGIRMEDQGRLFGSFVRLENRMKTTAPGTGLGLYLTRKLVTEVLSGQVGVESREGEGSRFWLRLPVDLKAE